MSLPKVSTIRNIIQTVQPTHIQKALMFQYLTCGRAKEVVSRTTPGDKSGRNKPSGPSGSDARLDKIGANKIAIFKVYTQKRNDKERLIALPLRYEPWAKDLYDYFKTFGKSSVFNFTRQELWSKSKPYFKDYTYEIEQYKIWKDKVVVKFVSNHNKTFTLHALRHLRATELIEYYGFSGFDLSIYGGWTIQQSYGRYIGLNWQSYIGKLMKNRTW
jgi:hypothetical protein